MESQNRILIGKINGSEIFAVSTESGDTFVPIKPVCEAIGIAAQSQHLKLQEHPILSPTVTLRVIVASDGKAREMVCLPLEFIYGWIFTINPKNVSDAARSSIMRYQLECYKALYNHFFGRSGKLRELDSAERDAVALLGQLDKKVIEAEQSVREAKAERAEARSRLDMIRASRLDDTPSLFD